MIPTEMRVKAVPIAHETHVQRVWLAPRTHRRSQIPSAVNFGDDRGEVGHIGNKVWPAGDDSGSDARVLWMYV